MDTHRELETPKRYRHAQALQGDHLDQLDQRDHIEDIEDIEDGDYHTLVVIEI